MHTSWQEAESHYTNYIFPATGGRDPLGMGGEPRSPAARRKTTFHDKWIGRVN